MTAPAPVAVHRGYARVANADPLSGVPAVVGEIWDDPAAALDRCPQHWPPGLAIDDVRELRPRLYARCVELACAVSAPTHRLVRFTGDDVEIVHDESLTLTPEAQLRFLYEQHVRGAIDPDELLRLVPAAAARPPRGRLSPHANRHLVAVAHGVPCSGAVATGVLARDEDVAIPGARMRTILVVERIEAQHTALLHDPRCAGVVALRGSPADHFTILARETKFGYLALPGHALEPSGLRCADTLVEYGSPVTVDFGDGRVFAGAGAIDAGTEDPARSLGVGLLAERRSPVALRLAVDDLAALDAGMPADVSGIGLLRTEHLLRLNDRSDALRCLLEDGDDSARARSLAPLRPWLQQQFERVLRRAAGLPVTIRLLDYPLHELDGSSAHEVNPMLGLRGVRQGVRWPALYSAQIDALLAAAVAVRAAGTFVPVLEILVPMVCSAAEVGLVRAWVRRAQEALPEAHDLAVRVGAMLETPAALADIEAIADECDFAAFGTSDLTQLCLGLSREDYVGIVEDYRERDLLAGDPFERLHPVVLRLISDAAARARAARPQMTLSLCGRHAADPQSLELVRAGLLDHLTAPIDELAEIKLQALRPQLGAERPVTP